MSRQTRSADLLARRLMRAAEEDLRRWLDVKQLDYELLGVLYLRVEEVLERSPELDDNTVEELALTIYLTAAAWQSKSDAPVELLVSLRRAMARTLSIHSPRVTT